MRDLPCVGQPVPTQLPGVGPGGLEVLDRPLQDREPLPAFEDLADPADVDVGEFQVGGDGPSPYQAGEMYPLGPWKTSSTCCPERSAETTGSARAVCPMMTSWLAAPLASCTGSSRQGTCAACRSPELPTMSSAHPWLRMSRRTSCIDVIAYSARSSMCLPYSSRCGYETCKDAGAYAGPA